MSHTCIWTATGDFECVGRAPRSMDNVATSSFASAVEPYRDPATDPNCAEYGCAAGRACKTTSDCASGLSCVNLKCARNDPFKTTAYVKPPKPNESTICAQLERLKKSNNCK